ncbi:MAG TPA: hypothetical protein PLK82_00575, partial [Bacteroidales bacterium]|nr:hypothetical protein [Bacteroidales bacterium]
IASWRGNDLVTLFIAIPVFTWALLYSQAGSVVAKYVWFAMLFYGFYNNCFYLFGASVNPFFIVYVAISVSSLICIILVAANYHMLQIEKNFTLSKTLRIVIGSVLFLFGGIIMAMWVSEWLRFVLYGIKPVIPGMNEGYGLVAAVDLTIQVPVMFTGAVLLWRRKPLGYLLSFVSTVANTIYLLVLIAFCPFAEKAGLSKAWDGLPMFGSQFVLCLVSSILFFRNTIKIVQ